MWWWGGHVPPLKTVRQRRMARPGRHAVHTHGKFVSAELSASIQYPSVPSVYRCYSACKHAADPHSPAWGDQGLPENKSKNQLTPLSSFFSILTQLSLSKPLKPSFWEFSEHWPCQQNYKGEPSEQILDVDVGSARETPGWPKPPVWLDVAPLCGTHPVSTWIPQKDKNDC